MRLNARLIVIAAFVCAAGIAWLGAVWAVTLIERSSTEAVAAALADAGVDWATVRADGLQMQMTGTAPSEAERFRALTVAGSLIDSTRVIDLVQVAEAKAIAAPRYSVEILRNDDGISLIGLIPAAEGRAAILATVQQIAAGAKVTDLLETAEHAVPEGWAQALTFGLTALNSLPRSKISILADRVAITAISDSADHKRRLEAELSRAVPDGLRLELVISAPRPVIAPFTLRFLIDGQGARFDACSVDTEAARDTVLKSAAAAGTQGKADCVIGLGVPSPNWARAVATAIAGLAELGGGTLTFSNANVSLIAGPSVTQAAFDRVVGDLEARLPDVFSLSAAMPGKEPSVQAESGPVEFTATLAEDGQVQLRGRLPDERVRAAVDSFARARFGSEAVYTAARLDGALPAGWPVRVLSALEALAELDRGDVKVLPDLLEVRGVTGNPQASAEISRILSEKLGQGQDFRIIVSYDKALDPNAGLPTPRECIASIETLLARQKISFAPGKAEIDPAANPTLNGIAKVLTRCGALPMEVGGHTDSQGRDEMNLALSQSRAEAVVQALIGRGVLIAAMTAKGFGETEAIADNKTEEGREANRRIAFKLLLSEEEAAKIAAATVAADAAALAAASAAAAQDAQSPVTEAATADTAAAVPEAEAEAEAEAEGSAEVVVLPATENQIRPKRRPEQN